MSVLLNASRMLKSVFNLCGRGCGMSPFAGRPVLTSPNDDSPDHTELKNRNESSRLIRFLDELTIRIDSVVNHHSQQIREIAEAIESRKDPGEVHVLDVAKQLITADQNLKSELKSVKHEIQLRHDQIMSFDGGHFLGQNPTPSKGLPREPSENAA